MIIRDFIDKIKPQFEKGGKLEIFQSTFEAFETFIYVPNTTTRSGAHIRDRMDMKRAMIVVVLALVPCLLFGTFNIGYEHYKFSGTLAQTGFWDIFLYGVIKIFPMLCISYIVGLGIEFAFAQLRGHEVNEGYLVTGMLIPLICPPDTPLWMLTLAVIFAVVIGKEVFGGTGMNIWNPALIARAFLFFAYPSAMSGDKVWVADAASGATPLANALQNGANTIPHLHDLFWGFMPGSIGETSKICILIGAAILLYTRVANFRTMISVVFGGLFMALVINLLAGTDPLVLASGAKATFYDISPLQHIMMGGFLFGAVFMSTDPVSGSQTQIGRYIYGFLTGVLVILIRAFNPAYPEGMMLAILFMNTFAPLIDYLVIEQNKKRRRKRLIAVQTLKQDDNVYK